MSHDMGRLIPKAVLGAKINESEGHTFSFGTANRLKGQTSNSEMFLGITSYGAGPHPSYSAIARICCIAGWANE
jgi:hypothetical protein